MMKRRMLCSSISTEGEAKMTQFLRSPFGFLILIAMLVTACAATQIKTVWKDPSYQARPTKIMVIGVAKNPLSRRMFEDEFVLQLKARGTDALASSAVLPAKLQ